MSRKLLKIKKKKNEMHHICNVFATPFALHCTPTLTRPEFPSFYHRYRAHVP